MTKLISYSDLAPYKHLTANFNAAKFDTYVNAAQEFDLRKLLGTELYIDLMDDFEASPSLVTYGELMSGCTYTYLTRKYKHEGLIPVIGCFTFARYLMDSNAFSTPFGMMQKKNSDVSEPISEKSIARKIAQAQSEALSYFERVKLYIVHQKQIDSTKFILYRTQIKSSSGIRISAAGGNAKDRYKRIY